MINYYENNENQLFLKISLTSLLIQCDLKLIYEHLVLALLNVIQAINLEGE